MTRIGYTLNRLLPWVGLNLHRKYLRRQERTPKDRNDIELIGSILTWQEQTVGLPISGVASSLLIQVTIQEMPQ